MNSPFYSGFHRHRHTMFEQSSNVSKNFSDKEFSCENQNKLNHETSENKKKSVNFRQKMNADSIHRAGDWICNICSNHNYSFREVCNSCKIQTKVENLKQSIGMCRSEQPPETPKLPEKSKFKKKLSIKSGFQFERMVRDNKSLIWNHSSVVGGLSFHRNQSASVSSDKFDTEEGDKETSWLRDHPTVYDERVRNTTEFRSSEEENILKDEPTYWKIIKDFKNMNQIFEDSFCEFPFEKNLFFDGKEQECHLENLEGSANESDSVEIDKKTLELLAFD